MNVTKIIERNAFRHNSCQVAVANYVLELTISSISHEVEKY